MYIRQSWYKRKVKNMGNITVYISKEDQKIFDRARCCGSSLSKVIAAALKEYLERKDLHDQ